MDQRYNSIKSRLEALPSKALLRFLNYPGPVCYDTYNYNSAEGAYCPIAIMLGVPDYIKENDIEPTQEVILDLIKRLGTQYPGFVFGTVKDEVGDFYTQDREQDLKKLCLEILKEREKDFLQPGATLNEMLDWVIKHTRSVRWNVVREAMEKFEKDFKQKRV